MPRSAFIVVSFVVVAAFAFSLVPGHHCCCRNALVAQNPLRQQQRQPNSLLEAAGSFLSSLRVATGRSATVESNPARLSDNAGDFHYVDDLGEGSTMTVGWSQRYGHPSTRGASTAAVVNIADTSGHGTAAAVRATRGFQGGGHYWEVQVSLLSDLSFVGFVSAHWTSYDVPIGHAPHSWGVASNGSVFANSEEVMRLPRGYGTGSTVGVLLNAGDVGLRTASIFVDGRRYDDAFSELGGALYPAVSNMRAAARYVLVVDCRVPGTVAPETAVTAAPLVATSYPEFRAFPLEDEDADW